MSAKYVLDKLATLAVRLVTRPGASLDVDPMTSQPWLSGWESLPKEGEGGWLDAAIARSLASEE